MKIVLKAFQNKLTGVMEVPEETGNRFRLAMTQPVQVNMYTEQAMMPSPIDTICVFEWTGGTYHQEGHEWNGARQYQLISIDKR